jgi:hypothetical protein
MIALAIGRDRPRSASSRRRCPRCHVVRVPKTYPAYFGTYDRFDDLIRDYTDTFENLFLVGRNGMHKYNNQDHSMLTAMTAVDNILAGIYSTSPTSGDQHRDGIHEEK